ncbi:ubiquinone menaquinone biosynthesis methyltransferase UbiE [Butyriboletus roseoflavus]|nr:ubiquinone menaquinone biosynthesis methyltransferase UbiE [Butyriboletus roseoflavus]
MLGQVLFCRKRANRQLVAPILLRKNHGQATSSSQSSGRSASFGFKTVPEESKDSLVKGVFDSVASKYDLMNDASSLGIHRLWKDTFVSTLRPGRKGPIRCIDVAGGTGDIALRILDHAREEYADRETSVEVVDINAQMLVSVRHELFRDITEGCKAPQVSLHEANAQELPPSQFKGNSYDLYTIAFGIRNCTSIPAVLKEAHRVLKPGGTFACLEFSKVNNPLLSTLYDQYSFSVIPLIGAILAGDRDSYQYLVESIRKFPSQPEFAGMIRDAGFATGRDHDGGAWTDLWGGIACIHRGVKI